ncbi:MAG: hypothetical protein M3417_14880 [Actinomycetota bacterium]|nr:hypothetical protein [Actinomycetota bacterium]
MPRALLPLLALGCGEDGEPEADARADLVAAATVSPPRNSQPAAANGTPADDAEAATSFPVADPSTLTERAPSPEAAKPVPAASRDASTPESYISPGAPSDEQIMRELRQMERIRRSYEKSASGSAGGATLNPDGTASPPNGAPEVVRRIIGAGNAIARFPYVYGGGHGSFVDTAYDCSGSVSYALAAAGLVERPMVSGEFAKTGEAGPGTWVTIYANDGHMFMVVAGLRYDTSGRGGPLGSRWQTASRSTKGLEVRHPPGL